ncbi:hypothetical protein I4U23_029736 [Adineta vaga]|nr:hypothetical protein I4U23_029736 [Adineta vaga]
MVRKKSVVKRSNDEKENDNPLSENDSPLVAGQKRSIELVDTNTVDDKEIEIKNLKRRCADLEYRVEILEKTCSDMVSIQELCEEISQNSNNNKDGIAAGGDISGFMTGDIDGIVPMNVQDVVVDYNDTVIPTKNDNNATITCSDNDDTTGRGFSTFTIDNKILTSLKKDSKTTTARSILKYLFPDPQFNCKLSDVDKLIVDEIIKYVEEMHPDDTATTTAKVKHSMSNYFGSINHKKKKALFRLNKNLKTSK